MERCNKLEKYPFQLVAVDLILLPKTSSGHLGCLMVVDHYSKFVSAVPLRDKRSQTVVRAFRERIIPMLPQVPSSILSDNGPEFASAEFAEFIESFGMTHIFTTPYHPAVQWCGGEG